MKRQVKGDVIIFDDYDPYNFKGIYDFVDHLEKQKTYKFFKLFSDKNRGYAIGHKL